jgi:excisionase family DNA binding protein
MQEAQKRVVVSYFDAAEMLSVSDRTIWAMVRDGRLKALRIGRAVRIPVAEIERFVREHSQVLDGGAE